MSLVRIRGVDRRGLRDGYRPRAGGAAPFVGVVDELTAAGDTVNFAVSTSYQLDTAGGNYVRVRRASDSVEADIPIDTGTHVLDSAALAAHCGASDGFAVTTYDRGVSARDYTNATTAEQPKIYDGATGIVLTGSLPMALLDGSTGAAGTGDGWARGDAGGFAAVSPGFTMFWFGSLTDITTTNRTCFAMGVTSVFALRYLIVAAGFGAHNLDGSNSAGAYRLYTAPVALSTPSDYVLVLDAGANMSTATLYQRGVLLAEAAVVAGSLSIDASASGIGSNSVQARGVTGRFGACIGVAGGAPSAGTLTTLFALGADMRTAAGV